MKSLTNIWKDKGIATQTKKRLLNSLGFSIATYGSECWVLTKADKKKISAFELWCYRRLLRISWTERKTNEWVLSRMNCNERVLLTSINERKMTFVGHVLRKHNFEKNLLTGSVYRKRGSGRPKIWHSDNIKENMNERKQSAAHECPVGQFSCGDSSYCVERKYNCDGVKNCPNGADEEECGLYISVIYD
ncbi:Relaxin receptor 2 [Nymphon striatum]|nr:Relaxin receptor 2 [Nymphon striatum]